MSTYFRYTQELEMMNREQNVKGSDTTEDAQNNKAGYIKI